MTLLEGLGAAFDEAAGMALLEGLAGGSQIPLGLQV